MKDTVHYLHVKDALADGTVVPAGYGIGNLEAITADYIARGGKVATLEPHLHAFLAYKSIDDHELKGKHKFNTGREAFDFAVYALSELLTNRGYRKDENGIWKK